MLGIRIMSLWNAWMNFSGVTGTMISLTEMTENFLHMQRMHTENCSGVTVKAAQNHRFVHNLKYLECIPHSKVALYQHVKRANIPVPPFAWHQTLDKQLCLPDLAKIAVN